MGSSKTEVIPKNRKYTQMNNSFKVQISQYKLHSIYRHHKFTLPQKRIKSFYIQKLVFFYLKRFFFYKSIEFLKYIIDLKFTNIGTLFTYLFTFNFMEHTTPILHETKTRVTIKILS